MILFEREAVTPNWPFNREVIGNRKAARDDSYEIKSHHLAEPSQRNSAHTTLEAIDNNEGATSNEQTQYQMN